MALSIRRAAKLHLKSATSTTLRSNGRGNSRRSSGSSVRNYDSVSRRRNRPRAVAEVDAEFFSRPGPSTSKGSEKQQKRQQTQVAAPPRLHIGLHSTNFHHADEPAQPSPEAMAIINCL